MSRSSFRNGHRSSHRTKIAAGAMGAMLSFGLISSLDSRDASAYCRTTTGPPPTEIGECFADGPTYYPLFWKNLCVGYSLSNALSRQISLDVATSIASTSFSHWTGTTCASDGTSGSRVSIDARDLGPVDCDTNTYVTGQPNQHVIFFSDDAWPYGDATNTLGKTFVTFDSDTGEIYDADMAINTFQYTITTSDPVPKDGYDLESIMTHEAGHFLGLAHSDNQQAVMYPTYNPGATNMRNLTDDDIQGICDTYHPDGNRTVIKMDGSEVTPGDACDPTPRGGFGSACPVAKSSMCTVSPALGGTSNSLSALAIASSIALVFGLRSRSSRRRRHSSRS